MNNMRDVKIEKVTVNIGVGEAGERLLKAETVLESLAHQKPVRTLSKTTNKEWGLRKKMPIGCKVTLRKKKADDFLKRALWTRNNKLADWSFDDEGHVSFGVPDHTEFKEMKYDPKVGVFGMDVAVTFERAGYRLKRRRIAKRRIPGRHRVTPDETIEFLEKEYKVEVV